MEWFELYEKPGASFTPRNGEQLCYFCYTVPEPVCRWRDNQSPSPLAKRKTKRNRRRRKRRRNRNRKVRILWFRWNAKFPLVENLSYDNRRNYRWISLASEISIEDSSFFSPVKQQWINIDIISIFLLFFFLLFSFLFFSFFFFFLICTRVAKRSPPGFHFQAFSWMECSTLSEQRLELDINPLPLIIFFVRRKHRISRDFCLLNDYYYRFYFIR